MFCGRASLYHFNGLRCFSSGFVLAGGGDLYGEVGCSLRRDVRERRNLTCGDVLHWMNGSVLGEDVF